MKTLHLLTLGLILVGFSSLCNAQTADNPSPPAAKPKWDYQIYLTKPAKEIKELKFEKDCSDIKGTISQDKKTLILKDYEQGKRVYVKILYEDGTEEEFMKSSCFIDPVI